MSEEGIKVLQNKYRLTDEEYEAYYKETIMSLTARITPVDEPKLVFVVGQPGAGKSKLIPIINSQLNFNAVIADYDQVRQMHPKYDIASQEVPADIHMALLPDADRMNEDLRHYCRDHNLNLIYEGTMRGTAVFMKIAEEFKEANYEVDVAAMSVPKLQSYGSTIIRYATDLNYNNKPRWVSKEVHDTAYENLLITLRKLLDAGLIDKTTVWRRGNKKESGNPVKIYSSEEKQFADIIQAIEFGRSRYREEAVANYPLEHSICTSIFTEHAPSFLSKLEEWEKLYVMEKRDLERDEQDI